tara:strand:- start:821 stop:2152 length:1332 start_codon:yes stop_codon:yes gene_type:complete
MRPGYIRKIKDIDRGDSDGGFINKNQALDLIEEYTRSHEFYGIEPALVLNTYLDAEAGNYPKIVNDDGSEIPDWSAYGSVQVRLLYSQPGINQVYPSLIAPIHPHVVTYPMPGEIVNVAEYDGRLFYHNPLGRNNNINSNQKIPKSSAIKNDTIKYNRKVYAEPGDTLFQGRFGQTIHFGSDKNNTKPNIKISVGQGYNSQLNQMKAVNQKFVHLEKINDDEASIYITTNENVGLRTASHMQSKSAFPMGTSKTSIHSLITMNSDSIYLNAKHNKLNEDTGNVEKNGRIQMFATKGVNISAQDNITLETQRGNIYLGNRFGNNPMVKGQELKALLRDLVVSMNTYVSAVERTFEDEWIYDSLKDVSRSFKRKLKKIRDQLKAESDPKKDPCPFTSKRFFIDDEDNWSAPNIDWESSEEPQPEIIQNYRRYSMHENVPIPIDEF